MDGRTIPEDQFFDELSDALGELLQRDIKLGEDDDSAPAEPAADDPPATFALSDTDSIRVRFEEDTIVLILQNCRGSFIKFHENIPVFIRGF